QSVPSLEQTDSALAAGSPFLPVFKPALFLRLSPRFAFGRTIRNRNPLHALLMCGGFILRREESVIRRNQIRRAARELFMFFDGGNQKLGVAWLLVVNLV